MTVDQSLLVAILFCLAIILGKVLNMAATLDDINAALAAVATEQTAEAATLSASLQLIVDDCNELLNKPPTDFTTQVQAIQANAAKMKAAVDAVNAGIAAEDKVINPPGPSDFAAPKA